MSGNTGTDQFWIASAEIPDTVNVITDFTIGEDLIGLAGLSIGFEDLTISDSNGDALIATSESDLAILQDVVAASLNAENFVFV